MMATYRPNLVSRTDDDQISYPQDPKLPYDEFSSQQRNTAIYIDQASAEFFSGNSPSPHKSSEFLPIGDRNEMMFIPPTSDSINLQPIDEQFNSEHNFQGRGLSLSLGTEMESNLLLPSLLSPNLLICEGDENNRSKRLKNPDNRNLVKPEGVGNSQCFNGLKDFQDMLMYESSGYSNVLNPKYLKATQELLSELVSIRKALKQPQADKCFNRMSSSPGEPVTNLSEVSPAERHELQNKKTKLMSMYDEVNRRYKQYYHQMQCVETSFDIVVGQGAAKSYTALALQTISRHFRTLRDSISSQIEIIRRRLGDEDNGQGPLPRLRLVDQQLRQQRALMQHGVIAWRPQRGLPENSVSVLQAWLFEHFLHPYPNDSEKIKLAKQTGLTRNQVANWFINARVRLWKPMIEDIYKEEFGDLEGRSISYQDDISKADRPDSVTSADADEAKMTKLTAKPPLQSSTSHEDKVTENSEYINFQQDYTYYSDKNIGDNLLPNSIQYDISGLSGFGIDNQVTLELGLQHYEGDIRGNNSIASNLGPDRFGNSHLLHDFVV